MNKLKSCIVIVMLLFLVVFGSSFFGQENGSNPENLPQSTENISASPVLSPDQIILNNSGQAYSIVGTSSSEFRAVWVATVFNLDFPTQQNLSATAMKREIDAIAAFTAGLGLNAIIFQVRPACDAFYQSDIFPWSQWLTGVQGRGRRILTRWRIGSKRATRTDSSCMLG